MFAGKALVNLSEGPFRSSTLGLALSLPQTLDSAGEACQGLTLHLIKTLTYYGRKSFITFGPGLIFATKARSYL